MASPISTQQLSYNEKEMRFVGEVSSCPITRHNTTEGWKDGVQLVSHMTGRTALFLLREIVRDDEGEVVAYILRPTFGSVNSNRGLSGVTLHLLND